MKKWHEVYHDIAKRIYELIEYPVRPAQILQNDIKVKNTNKELFELFYADDDFREFNKWVEKFAPNNGFLDPLHIFASLNAAKLNQNKRLKRVQIICRLLNLDIPEMISFIGCPTPVSTKVLVVRGYDQQLKLTNCFNQAFNNDNKSLEVSFDAALGIDGIDVVNLSIFLFWINPDKFMPLDKNTTDWISTNAPNFRMPRIKSFKDYLDCLNIIKNNISYLELANLAYNGGSEEHNYKIVDKADLEDSRKAIEKRYEQDYRYCKLFAIKILDSCSDVYSKSVAKNKLYLFDNQFKVKDDNILLGEEISIFNPREKNNSSKIKEYNIYAIVGKNGSGKSTLIELILASIQKSRKLIMNDSSDGILKGLCIELYFYINDEVYYLAVEEENIYLYQYEKSIVGKEFHFTRSNRQIDDKQIIKEIINISYHLSINYSHFAFNSRLSGQEWVTDLFHRNDSYQTPLLLEPYRDDGNLDINLQTDLAKSRLMLNLIKDSEDTDADDKYKIKFLKGENFAESFRFKLNQNKIKHVNELLNMPSNRDLVRQFAVAIINKYSENIQKIFDSNNVANTNNKYFEVLITYLVYKVLSFHIHETKPKYEREEDNLYIPLLKNFCSAGEIPNVSILENLFNDYSFRTYKVRQILNYILFYDDYKDIEEYCDEFSFEVGISKLSDLINKIKTTNNNYSSSFFIYPSLFDVDIILDDKSTFNQMSSGEKQLVYSLNTVFYHLSNLCSLDDSSASDINSYKSVNVFFDEIELYFHPELQRQFIDKLLNMYMYKLLSNNMFNINFYFITHSPFILSDIPKSKILFMDDYDDELNTLGANIHELLIKGMFLKNTSGEYIISIIKEVFQFHTKLSELIKAQNKSEIYNIKNEYLSNKDLYQYVSRNIGEQIYANKLRNIIFDIESLLFSEEQNAEQIKIRQQIKQLELQLSQIGGNHDKS